MLLSFCKLVSQNTPDLRGVNLSPNGVLEKVYDRFGKAYKLSDIKKPNQANATITNKSVLINCSPSSIFNLYFEPGCGMDSTTDPIQIARRTVVCQVFQDISNFINTPLTITGNKVNIWVRNINNMSATPNNFLGLATSLYSITSSSAAGGIADGEVWKTITLGVDSYANVASPLVTSGANSNGTGAFFHGIVGFNFNTTNSPPVNWHTNLASMPASGFSDLYTVALHEITHALGFASLIDENGNSKFGTDYKYYSRYDRFLKNNANNALITNTGACSSMYNYNFNTAIAPSVLRPGCTLPNNTYNGSLNTTLCANAIKFVGSTTVQVYAPTCFEPASSLSHFEDQLFPSCASPNGNDTYFVMSNANAPSTIKRYLKSEERIALCDLGYSVKTVFGANTTLIAPAVNGPFSYGGVNCAGTTVAGVNDGLNTNGTFAFTPNQNANISISKAILLSNDKNATGLECVQDLTAAASITMLLTSITFNSAIAGLHLLRYVPINASGQKGNITYIYVYVKSSTNCAIPTFCNLVVNGDFEQNSSLPSAFGDINKACGWFAGNGSTPEYYYAGAIDPQNLSLPGYNIPCNYMGTQNSNNNSGNGYIGMWTHYNYDNFGVTEKFHENIVTKLTIPLIKNVTYQLSFDVSLAEGASSFVNKIQAYLSKSFIPISSVGEIVIIDPTMLLTNPTFSRVTNGWQTISFTFIAKGGEQYLFLGGLSNVQVTQNIASTGNNSCAYYNFNIPDNIENRYSYYYLDNVNLIGLDLFARFSLPTSTACHTSAIADLSAYLFDLPNTGVFSGNGVVLNSGVYSFSPTIAGIGTHTLCFKYTNPSTGCEVKLYSTITVNDVATIPTFIINPVVCAGNTTPLLPSISLEDIVGTWSPAIISNSVSQTYTFTPNLLLYPCATTATVAITVQNDAVLITNNDNYNLPMQNVAQTTPSVLLNDNINGVLMTTTTPNITITSSLPSTNTGVSTYFTFNSNGTITILPGIPAGNYVISYKLKATCGISNTAQINITIFPTITHPGKHMQLPVCVKSVNQISESNFSDQTAFADGIGILLNGIPALLNQIEFFYVNPYGNYPLPAGVTVNTNGTLNIPANTPVQGLSCLMKICATGSNTNCSEPFLVHSEILPKIQAINDGLIVSPTGIVADQSTSTSFSTTRNVLRNDMLCTTQANLSNVNLTFLSSTSPLWTLSTTTGLINNPTDNYNPFHPQVTITYKICDLLNPTVCAIGTHSINVVSSFRTANPSLKNLNIKNNNLHFKTLNEIVIFPNPSSGLYTINLQNNFKKEFVIEVYNLLGQQILKTISANEQYQLDLDIYNNGIYIVKIFDGNDTILKRIIKQ